MRETDEAAQKLIRDGAEAEEGVYTVTPLAGVPGYFVILRPENFPLIVPPANTQPRRPVLKELTTTDDPDFVSPA